ncbi:uncharacterized protein LOC107363103 [Tetranychus urticae]|uniref:Uncharacterized protein n=1 Tax=Tetranychus urticae TaxID=32264 RepID=T1KEG6_TETUR|nr:uncharacterized protein LOC107363103 [Tetranychus urticae]
MFGLTLFVIKCCCLQFVLSEEVFDSGSNNDFRENIHNGKFVIYDQIDRQMVESAMDEVMVPGEDESFPFMTKVLPDYQHKDSQTIHTYMLPPEAEDHFDNFERPLSMEINDKFGYHVNGNHQIQVERPFKPPNQRSVAFKTAESVAKPIFAINYSSTTSKPIQHKLKLKERPSLAPTSFIKHPDKTVSAVDRSIENSNPMSNPTGQSSKIMNALSVTPASVLSPTPLSSSIKAFHVPREDDKKQFTKAHTQKKYFPEPVKMTTSPRFESLRIKAIDSHSITSTTPRPSVSTYSPPSLNQHNRMIQPRPTISVSTISPPTMTSSWKTNSRVPSWNSNWNQKSNHYNYDDDYLPGDKITSQSTPYRYQVESPRGFNGARNLVSSQFTDLEDFEQTSASDEVGRSVAHLPQPTDSFNQKHTPISTRIAVENHPDLSEKQRDSLLKILESYYKLIHQFNLDFRKLITDSKGKTNSKENGTIVIEPIAVEPSRKSKN